MNRSTHNRDGGLAMGVVLNGAPVMVKNPLPLTPRAAHPLVMGEVTELTVALGADHWVLSSKLNSLSMAGKEEQLPVSVVGAPMIPLALRVMVVPAGRKRFNATVPETPNRVLSAMMSIGELGITLVAIGAPFTTAWMSSTGPPAAVSTCSVGALKIGTGRFSAMSMPRTWLPPAVKSAIRASSKTRVPTAPSTPAGGVDEISVRPRTIASGTGALPPV